MTTENIETKAVEAVAENKETIAKVINKGDRKMLYMVGAAAATATGAILIKVAVGKVKKKKEASKNTEPKEVKDILKEAGEALDDETVVKVVDDKK